MHIEVLTGKLEALITVSRGLINQELQVQDFLDQVEVLRRLLQEIRDIYSRPAEVVGVTDVFDHGLAGIIDLFDEDFLQASFVLKAADESIAQLRLSQSLPASIVLPCERTSELASAGAVVVRAWKKRKAYDAIFAGSSWRAVNVKDEASSIFELSGKNIGRLKQRLEEDAVDRRIDAEIEEELAREETAEEREAYNRVMAALSERTETQEDWDKDIEARAERLRASQVSMKVEEPALLPPWLLDDEAECFRALLALPFHLKHATNGWYRILNDGKLDAYSEIQRRDPSWTSEFSTNGNIRALGNGGFVFFRVEVGDAAMTKTRYGETQIVYPFSLIGSDGWLSLYDQLKPLSSESMKYFYDDAHQLVRHTQVSGTGDIYISYQYGKAPKRSINVKHKVIPKTGQKTRVVAATSFEEHERYTDIVRDPVPFSHLVFHGGHAPLGIALAVLNELRYLHDCGFRASVLKRVSTLSGQALERYLGRLVVRFFRPEAKFPVALRFFMSQAPYHVEKEEGDERYDEAGQVNEAVMAYIKLERRYSTIQERLSILRRQIRRAENAGNQQSLPGLNVEAEGLVKERDSILANYQFQDGRLWEKTGDGWGKRFGETIKLYKK